MPKYKPSKHCLVNLLGQVTLGWGLLSQYPPFRYFTNFSALSKHTLDIEYHVHIWQTSPQLGCNDTCEIWMCLKELLNVLLEDKKIAYGEINERSFINPHPWCPCRNYNDSTLPSHWKSFYSFVKWISGMHQYSINANLIDTLIYLRYTCPRGGETYVCVIFHGFKIWPKLSCYAKTRCIENLHYYDFYRSRLSSSRICDLSIVVMSLNYIKKLIGKLRLCGGLGHKEPLALIWLAERGLRLFLRGLTYAWRALEIVKPTAQLHIKASVVLCWFLEWK